MGAALIAAVLTGLATGVGALPFVFVRDLGRRVYDGILGLGAGLMMAAATLGLLSEALGHGHGGITAAPGRVALVALGFLCGVLIVAAMDRLIPHQHASGHHQHLGHKPGHDRHDRADELRRGYAVLGALSIHRLPEGLAIGAGFAADDGSQLGILLAVSVAIQNICEGIVMAAPLQRGGLSPLRGLVVVSMTGAAIPLGAVLGLGLAALATAAMPFILALAGGALIYVTSNEVIPESHSHGHEGTASLGLVIGFLLTMVLQGLLH